MTLANNRLVICIILISKNKMVEILESRLHFYAASNENSKTFSYVFCISYLYLYQPAACLAKWTLSDRLKAAWNLIENKIDCPIICHLLNSLVQTIRHQDFIRMSASASKFRNLKYYLWNMRYHPKTAPLKRLRPVVLG